MHESDMPQIRALQNKKKGSSHQGAKKERTNHALLMKLETLLSKKPPKE